MPPPNVVRRAFEGGAEDAVLVGPRVVGLHFSLLDADEIVDVPEPVVVVVVLDLVGAVSAALVAVVLHDLVAHAAVVAAGIPERCVGPRPGDDDPVDGPRKMIPKMVLGATCWRDRRAAGVARLKSSSVRGPESAMETVALPTTSAGSKTNAEGPTVHREMIGMPLEVPVRYGPPRIGCHSLGIGDIHPAVCPGFPSTRKNPSTFDFARLSASRTTSIETVLSPGAS